MLARSHCFPKPHSSPMLLGCCRVSISPFHKVSHGASMVLSDHTHVLRPLMRRRYENVLDRRQHWKQGGLWIQVTGNSMSKSCKRVVRNWARRRIEQALVEKLKERGYDRTGRRLNQNSAKVTSTKNIPCHFARQGSSEDVELSSLCGTVSIQVREKIMESKYPEVQQQAGLVVSEVLRICRQHHARTS